LNDADEDFSCHSERNERSEWSEESRSEEKGYLGEGEPACGRTVSVGATRGRPLYYRAAPTGWCVYGRNMKREKQAADSSGIMRRPYITRRTDMQILRTGRPDSPGINPPESSLLPWGEGTPTHWSGGKWGFLPLLLALCLNAMSAANGVKNPVRRKKAPSGRELSPKVTEGDRA